jgi:hypothetical protein
MVRFILPVLLLVASPAWARDTLDQFGRWGAFREGTHCYAIAEPAKDRPGASVTVSSSPARGVRVQFHARLSRAVGPGRPPVVRIGEWTLPLVARDRDAWAPDGRTDLRILAAIRAGDALAVTATDARGRRFSDRYPLAGAASAIDAAIVGCLGV